MRNDEIQNTFIVVELILNTKNQIINLFKKN